MQRLALMLGVAVAALAEGPETGTRDDAVRRARELLARRLSIQEMRVEVQAAEEAEWPDAGLGCPEPGMSYAQVVTSGYRVMLTVAGREYEVHVAGAHTVMCQPERGAHKPDAGARAEEISQASATARRDLARRLGLTLAEVRVKVVRKVAGKDQAGCSLPKAGDDAAAAFGQAYEVELEARDRTYRYLARQGRATYCGPLSQEDEGR